MIQFSTANGSGPRLLGFMLALIATLTSHATAASEGTVNSIRNKLIVTAAFDEWANGGTAFFTELIASNVVWTIEGSGPHAAVHHGRDALMERAVRPLAARLAVPLRPTMRRIWADGDHVIVNWEGKALAKDGRVYSNRYVWIMRMLNGKAAEVTAFLDLARFDEILLRAPASSSE